MDQPKPYIITIVGPESSGKTTLARELATHYEGLMVPEYAREYLEGLGRAFVLQDLDVIAEGQLSAQNSALASDSALFATRNIQLGDFNWQSFRRPKEFSGSTLDPLGQVWGKSILSFEIESFGNQPRPILVIDSGMLSLRMWAKLKFGIKLPVVEEALSQDVTSMYILCRPVYLWEPDPLREAPLLVDRSWIYNHYLSELMIIQPQ